MRADQLPPIVQAMDTAALAALTCRYRDEAKMFGAGMSRYCNQTGRHLLRTLGVPSYVDEYRAAERLLRRRPRGRLISRWTR